MNKILIILLALCLNLISIQVLAKTNTTPATKTTLETISLSIPKMSCPACPIIVKKALKKVSGVTKVTTDLVKQNATVTFDPKKTDKDKIKEATKNAGFPSSVIAEDSDKL